MSEEEEEDPDFYDPTEREIQNYSPGENDNSYNVGFVSKEDDEKFNGLN